MAYVMALDFGNVRSFPCVAEVAEDNRRLLRGEIMDLLPDDDNRGVPSTFFCGPDGKTLCCRMAEGGEARPVKYRFNKLKRSLGKPLTVDGQPLTRNGKPLLYDDAIREVVQTLVREANDRLRKNRGVTTHLICLAYPSTYSTAQRRRLMEIVSSATLADGTRLQVVGTIAEPAAAALDYLADSGAAGQQTVRVLDVGGGTTDVADMICYPQGKTVGGHTRYYEILREDGDGYLGGGEFDKVMVQLVTDKVTAAHPQLARRGLPPRLANEIQRVAEQLKIDLSTAESTAAELYISLDEEDEQETFPVTRAEFEKACEPLMARIVRLLEKAAADSRLPQPDRIVLTGGASQMPMVLKAVREQLPAAQRDRVVYFRPSRAVAYGAARYGSQEQDYDPDEPDTGTEEDRRGNVVAKRTVFELGFRFYHSNEDNVGFIEESIPAGTVLPFTSPWTEALKLSRSRRSTKQVYEARVTNPDRENPTRDYRHVEDVELDFGAVMPAGTPSQSRLVLDENGLLRLEARRAEGSPLFHTTATITDLT